VELGDRLAELQAEIERTKRSLAWRLATGFHAIRVKAVPPGSRRERLWTRLTRQRWDDRIPGVKAR
jgi:hypothetical protein